MKKNHALFLILLILTLSSLALVLRLRISGDTLSGGAEPTAEPSPEALSETPAPHWEIPAELSELMPANHATLAGSGGTFPDWIELVNRSGETRSLEGFWLSDEAGKPRKWQFPSVSLQPGEYLLVFCSGDGAGGDGLHASFSLGREGEQLLLSAPDGSVLWERRFPACEADQSVVFREGDAPLLCSAPTPGYENSDAGREAFLAAQDRHGALVINEAVLYNDSFSEQHHKYYDWVELKNASDEPVLLSDYYLSDDRHELPQFRLPEKTLGPGELYIVFCSGDDSLSTRHLCHAPFKLSAGGDALYLCGTDGSVSDYVSLRALPFRGSCGRMEGQPGFFYFKTPSPEANNTDGFRSIAGKPTASPEQGVFQNVESLQVELQGEGTIYYTTDGSVPTADSTRYDAPITLHETGILRAVSVSEGKVVSDCATFSYFLNEEHDLPIVSVVTEPRAIFGGYGIYTNWSSDEKRDANVAFFESDGSFSADCAIKLHGASSRRVWLKKNFKLIFQDRFGGALDYDLFGNGITSYHSIVLRGGDTAGMHMLRDELAARVANEVCEEPLALESRYCALYFNGSYFGLYALREAYSDQYVADHLGGSPESVQILRAPIKEGEPMEIVRKLIGLDMREPDNYAWACSVMDMESLCEWMALESFFNNLDPAGNLRYVSSDATGGRWRIAFFDLDIGLTSGYAGWEQMFNRGYQYGEIVHSLMQNPDFVRTLLECTSRLWRNGLGNELVLKTLDEFAAQTDSEARLDCRRWRESYDQYLFFLDKQRSFFNDTRTAWWLLSLQQYTKASDETMAQYFGDYPKI